MAIYTGGQLGRAYHWLRIIWKFVFSKELLWAVAGAFFGALLSIPVAKWYYLKSGHDLDAAANALAQKSDALAKKSDELSRKSDLISMKSDELARRSEALVQKSDELANKSDKLSAKSDELAKKSTEVKHLTQVMLLGMERNGWIDLSKDNQGNITGWNQIIRPGPAPLKIEGSTPSIQTTR